MKKLFIICIVLVSSFTFAEEVCLNELTMVDTTLCLEGELASSQASLLEAIREECKVLEEGTAWYAREARCQMEKIEELKKSLKQEKNSEGSI